MIGVHFSQNKIPKEFFSQNPFFPKKYFPNRSFFSKGHFSQKKKLYSYCAATFTLSVILLVTIVFTSANKILSFDIGKQNDDDDEEEEEDKCGRILIFATADNIGKLLDCDMWFVDGTFKTSPTIFFQLFSILGALEQVRADGTV